MIAKTVRKRKWSPSCTICRLRKETGRYISAQTVYMYLRQDGGRYPPLAKRYKRRHVAEHRGRIVGRVSIDSRPAIATRRGRRGDFETDMMQGKQGSGGALAVITDRRSRYTMLEKMTNREADTMNRCIIRALTHCPVSPRTLTMDNGKEFAHHRELREHTGVRCFFTDAYCAWQKGTVENTIGVLRRWLPKGYDLSNVGQTEVRRLQRWLNDRPMKILDYKTPNEVYNSSLTIAFRI